MKSVLLAACALFISLSAHAATEATLYKHPACGCCTAYTDYLRANGFTVTEHRREDMQAIKQQLGVAEEAQSCHTVKIGRYVVEGHVPVGAIHKLLKTQPDVRGIALPGMPANSPGMGPHQPGTLQVTTLPTASEPARPFSLE